MTSLAGLGGAAIDGSDFEVSSGLKGVSGRSGNMDGSLRRRGGLSVWYTTVDRDESVKDEECDFFATAKLDQENDRPVMKHAADSKASRGVLRKLVWAMPMSTLKDECEENRNRSWRVRSSLLANYGSVKCLTKFRDAHIYLFPYWVKDFARLNEHFDSVSEDLVGTWAKTDWRKSRYRARHGTRALFGKKRKDVADGGEDEMMPIEDEIDLMSLCSTQVTRHAKPEAQSISPSVTLASRVAVTDADIDADADLDDSTPSSSKRTPIEDDDDDDDDDEDSPAPHLPPILSYIHSPDPSSPLLRRIDSTPLLLSVSLLLAKLPSLDSFTSSTSKSPYLIPSPFAHPTKIAPTATISPQCSISTSTTLIGANATISTHCTISESVIGPSVFIGEKSRLSRCVVMDGAVIGAGCMLMECVVGKKVKIGDRAVLVGCEVQDGNVVAGGTEGKGENFLRGGLEDGEDGLHLDSGDAGIDGDGEGV